MGAAKEHSINNNNNNDSITSEHQWLSALALQRKLQLLFIYLFIYLYFQSIRLPFKASMLSLSALRSVPLAPPGCSVSAVPRPHHPPPWRGQSIVEPQRPCSAAPRSASVARVIYSAALPWPLPPRDSFYAVCLTSCVGLVCSVVCCSTCRCHMSVRLCLLWWVSPGHMLTLNCYDTGGPPRFGY